MNKFEKLALLAAKQASLSGDIARLKNLGSEEYSKCQGRDTADDGTGGVYAIGTSCIEKIATEFRDYRQEDYNFISFEEFYADAVAEELVCEHCQLTRKYKADRMTAQRQLGYVRSAITRIGKVINSLQGGEA